MSTAEHHEVAVVGAGPAGCAAALALAQGGLDVVLVEKHPLPRYKTCGGGVVARACRLLPSSAQPALQRSIHTVELCLVQAGLSRTVVRPEPILFTAMRAELDDRLTQAAVGAGAKAVTANPVRALSPGKECVELETASGRLRARFVVGADGADSGVAKLGGWSPLPRLCPALEYEVHAEGAGFSSMSDKVRFDFDAVERGYGWVFPKRDHLSIGLFTLNRGGLNLGAAMEQYLRTLGLPETSRVERHGWLIPLAPRREAPAKGRILLAGDAAGLADPVTAEGITPALWSGQLAAQAILESSLDGAKAARRYLSLLRTHILPELRAGRLLAHLLYSHRRFRDWMFRRKGQALTEFMVEVMMGRRTYRSALHNPWTILKAIW